MQKIYQQIGGPQGGIPPNFQLGEGPSEGSKGTAQELLKMLNKDIFLKKNLFKFN